MAQQAKAAHGDVATAHSECKEELEKFSCTTVMDPALVASTSKSAEAFLASALKGDPKLKAALEKAKYEIDVKDLAAKVTKHVGKEVADGVAKAATKEARKASEAALKKVGKAVEAQTRQEQTSLEKAKERYLQCGKAVTDACARMTAIEEDIENRMKSQRETEQELDGHTDLDTDGEADEDAVTKDLRKKCKSERKKLKRSGERLDALRKEVKDQEAICYKQFQKRLGGLASTDKEDGEVMKLEREMKKATAQSIKEKYRFAFAKRVKKYFAVLPEVEYVLDSFNEATGLHEKPPSIKDGYKSVPEARRELYAEQSKALFQESSEALGPVIMAAIRAKFRCGVNNTEQAMCGEDDGVMAMWCVFAKYGGGKAAEKSEVESQIREAATHFKWGDPKVKVEKLRSLLATARRLRITLKEDQTLIPIAQTVMNRNEEYIVPMSAYTKGCDKPDDCIEHVDDLCAEIETVSTRIEAKDGKQVWRTTEANYTNKGEWQDEEHHGKTKKTKNANNTERYQPYGKGKGKKGKGKKGKKGEKGGDREWWQGKHGRGDNQKKCNAKKCRGNGNSGKHEYCTECWTEGLRVGYIIMKNGDKKKMPKKDDKETTYTKKQVAAIKKKAVKKALKRAAAGEDGNESEDEDDEPVFGGAVRKIKRSKKGGKLKIVREFDDSDSDASD